MRTYKTTPKKDGAAAHVQKNVSVAGQIRCPECGAKIVDVADDYPLCSSEFFPGAGLSNKTIQGHCSMDHIVWIESSTLSGPDVFVEAWKE